MKKLLLLVFVAALCMPSYGNTHSDILVYKFTCSLNPSIDFTDANQTTAEEIYVDHASGYLVLNAKNADVADANIWQVGKLSGSDVFDGNQTLIVYGGGGKDKWYNAWSKEIGDEGCDFELHVFNVTRPVSHGLFAWNWWTLEEGEGVDIGNLYGKSTKNVDIGKTSKVEIFNTLKGNIEPWGDDYIGFGKVIWILDFKYTKDANKNGRTQQQTVDKIIADLVKKGYKPGETD
jgi:hypothetical protein